MFDHLFGQRFGKRDLQTLQDTEGNDWLVLYEVNANSNGLFAMAIQPNAPIPCPVHLVHFPITDAEQKRHERAEQQAKEAAEQEKRKHLTIVDGDDE